MNYPKPAAAARFLGVLLVSVGGTLAHRAQADTARYGHMAPIAQYRIANREEEISLARSAAPASISGRAQILILGAHGYETAVSGTNGFVCLVMRSWDQSFDHPEFWNPKIRGAECLNPAAVRSVLPGYLERTRWVLTGDSVARMRVLTEQAWASGELHPPEPGALAYMMSDRSYLGDATPGPWYPHVMFMMPRTRDAEWGANLPGSFIAADTTGHDGMTFFFVIVPKWSNGKSAGAPAAAGGRMH